MELWQVGAELFHTAGQTHSQTDRQTDMTKLIVAMRNFAKAAKSENRITCLQTKI
jgi:hypothetical protein